MKLNGYPNKNNNNNNSNYNYNITDNQNCCNTTNKGSSSSLIETKLNGTNNGYFLRSTSNNNLRHKNQRQHHLLKSAGKSFR